MIMPSRRKLGAAALIIAGIGAFLVPFLLHSPSTQGTSSNDNNGTHAKDYTSSSVTCSPSTIASGDKSTCTATVPDTTTSSNTPTGTVSFMSSNPGVGTVATYCTLSAGTCAADFAGAAAGTTTITGTYGGDSSHTGSSGSSNIIITTHKGSGGGNGGGNGGGSSTCGETKSHDPDPDPQAKGNGEHNSNAYGVIKKQMDTTIALAKAMGKSNPAFHLHHDTDTDNDKTHGPQSIHDHGDHDSSCAAGEEEHDKD